MMIPAAMPLLFSILLLIIGIGSTAGDRSPSYTSHNAMMIHRCVLNPMKTTSHLANYGVRNLKDHRGLQQDRSTEDYGFSNIADGAAVKEAKGTQSVEMVRAVPKVAQNLIRGAVLRIASDLTGGTPLECIKTRVTVTSEGPWEAAQNIVSSGGLKALWAGTPSRTVEGAVMGAMFLAGSVGTKRFILANGGSSTMAALCGGFVGGVVQSLVMTPSGMIFTSLNVNKGLYENENALTVAQRIWKQKGLKGMYSGIVPMAIRQSTNWASRAGLTEFARTQLRMSQFGLWGELGSGVLGGVGSCWNTPVETVRLFMQQDVSRGKQAKSFRNYVNEIIDKDGVPGLFRGVIPRSIQAIHQTAFMVVVPNLLGV